VLLKEGLQRCEGDIPKGKAREPVPRLDKPDVEIEVDEILLGGVVARRPRCTTGFFSLAETLL
jgi:hypothetical protein